MDIMTEKLQKDYFDEDLGLQRAWYNIQILQHALQIGPLCKRWILIQPLSKSWLWWYDP